MLDLNLNFVYILDICIQNNKESDIQLKRILRVEISYRKHTSLKDFQTSPELYKINQLSTCEMKVNLAILLTDDHNPDLTNDVLQFPSETAMVSVLQGSTKEVPESDQNNEYALNEPCIVIWDVEYGREWYVGIVRTCIDNEHYLIDHLERVPTDTTKKSWRYPIRPDEQIVETNQIVPCNIIGAWNYMSNRATIFELSNWEIIEGLYKSMYL